jgi:hypothetical protein
VSALFIVCAAGCWSLFVACLHTGAGPLQQLIEMGGPGAVVHSLDGVSSSSSNGGGSNGSSAATAGGVTIPRLEGDFSLNAANILSADLLLKSGLSRLCPTYDLNVSERGGIAHSVMGGGGVLGGGGSTAMEYGGVCVCGVCMCVWGVVPK